MQRIKYNLILKAPLFISILVVIPAAFIYGFRPNLLLDINLETADEYSFAKGVMGLYLAFAIFWCYGVIHAKYLKPALISNTLFMLGLGLGRIIGILLDGTPSNSYVWGMIGELALGFYGVWSLNSNYFKELA
jgi:hypothetical protein